MDLKPENTEGINIKISIVKKFSIYIIIMIMIILAFLVISVRSQQEVYNKNFENNIKFNSEIIAESVKNAYIIQYYPFLAPLMEFLTNQSDITYVFIVSDDNRVSYSTIESLKGKDIREIPDKFSQISTFDTKLTLRKNYDPFIRKKLIDDKKSVINDIDTLRRDYPNLRLMYSLEQVKDALKLALDTYKSIEDDERNTNRTYKLAQLKNNINLLNKMARLIIKREKKDAIIKRLDKQNLIYDVSVPLIGIDNYKYGILRIGYSPQKVKSSIIDLYIKSLIIGVIFLIVGLTLSFYLARTITKPIAELALGAEILGSGNLFHRIKIKTGDEIETLAESFNSMAEKLYESYTNLEHKVQERTREYLDATKELQRAYKKLQAAQGQLVQAEKMKSLGQLVAGVAHELNNPINFIYGNMNPLKTSLTTMVDLIELYNSLDLKDEDKVKIQQFKDKNDYSFMMDDLNDLIEDISEGAERAEKIISDLKSFSRLDEAEFKEVDIHQGINSTLNLLVNQYKYRITVHKDYGNLPLVSCYASQINQVWMNILVNAAQAISDKGEVTIKTRVENDVVVVSISDTGMGIKKEIIEKIFDPFYTTKSIGEGTGLGLSITHTIIKKHNGQIEVESEPNKGTTFIIKIPIKKDI